MAKPQYRRPHQALRVRLMRRLVPGTPCPQVVNGILCGQPMYATQDLDLGHAEDGGYLGLVHARCNRQEGAIRSNRGVVRRPLKRLPGAGRKW